MSSTAHLQTEQAKPAPLSHSCQAAYLEKTRKNISFTDNQQYLLLWI